MPACAATLVMTQSSESPLREPAVSVVIAVHNGERFIREAIASVLSQTLADLELIVVDDGSTDRTVDVIAACADPRIVLVRGPKRGTSAATNEGLRLCRAPLVARLDADDVMEPNRLERQVAFLEDRPSLGGAASYYWIIDEHGVSCGAAEPDLLQLEDVELQLAHGGRLVYAHPTIMFRRDPVLSLGGYDSRFDMCEDVDLFLRMHESGWTILVQPEKLTRFRVHSASISARNARAQHFLMETIFGNFRRRRRGEAELTTEQYIAEAQATPWRRVRTEAKILSRRLRRVHTVARMQRKPVAAALALTVAALIDPGATAGALRRKARRRVRRSTVGLDRRLKSQLALV
jgi:glycosyltransferase involved in cell wall biosynthesis